MLPINTIIYGLMAGLFVGLHVFSVKMLQLHFSGFLMLGSFLLWLISRLFLFWSFKTTHVSSFSHALLMIGLVVTIGLDHIILKQPLKLPMYLGIGCIILGYGIIIQYGY
jgi:drug/metabolite transporter (DMT)-like permease